MSLINELRIGNYVRCKASNDAGYYRVLSIDSLQQEVRIDRAGYELHSIDKIRPVRLHLEVVERLVFDLDNGTPCYPEHNFADLLGHSFQWKATGFIFNLHSTMTAARKTRPEWLSRLYTHRPFYFDSLHQIQNFAALFTQRDLHLSTPKIKQACP